MDIIGVSLFIIGLFFGSFYLVVATRLPKSESIIKPRSHCNNCNHTLNWYELIPVFSYVFLKGKCKKCKKHISLQYPFTEIITGVLFFVSYFIFGFSYETLLSLVLVSVVIITVITDTKFMVILDEVLIPASILIIIIFFISSGWIFALKSLLRGLILFLIILSIKLVGDKVYKTESLGWGDVKLTFLAGLVLGLKLGVVYLFIGASLALPYAIYTTIKKKNHMIPFGPFLSVSLLLIFWNSSIINIVINVLLGV